MGTVIRKSSPILKLPFVDIMIFSVFRSFLVGDGGASGGGLGALDESTLNVHVYELAEAFQILDLLITPKSSADVSSTEAAI